MIKDARCIFVTGRRGSGKTTLTQQLVKDSAAVIAFDPIGQYAAEFRWPNVADVTSLHRRLKADWVRGFRIAYTPAGDFAEQLHRLSLYLWEAMRGYGPRAPRKLTLVIEEANLSIPVTRLPDDRQGVMRLTLQGRHRGIEMIAVTQRPALVSLDFRGMCPEAYVFPLGNLADRAAFGREHAAAIASLTDHHYLHLTDHGATRGENPPLRRSPAPKR